jgi:hypothetical protein
MPRKILLALSAVAVFAAVMGQTALSAAAGPGQGRVGPNQVFAATVNGQSGVVTPAEIQMACFGPIRPGQTGHPLPGQTVEVFRPEAIVSATGFTGPNAKYIQAFFGAPPPPPVGPAPVGGTDVFTRYGVPKPISTSLLLPCSGTGNVYFVPLPMTPIGPARIATVHVSYVGQP